MKKIYFGIIVFLVVLIIPIQNVYSHGLGLDTISKINVGEKEISISVEIPMNFEGSDTQITITATDNKTGENVQNLTLLIELFSNNEQIIKEYFFTADGSLKIDVKPSTEINIQGNQKSLFDAWYSTELEPIVLSSPVFNTGGLYHFEIQIITIDDVSNVIDDSQIYMADVNTVSSTSYSEKSLDENNVTFKMKSYFDRISNFDYNPQEKIVTFEIPFDWSGKTISHIPVVHEEVHFPKGFAEFLTPSYTGKANGIELFKSSVTIDDYTEEDERIVHFVLVQDHLKFLKQEQKKSGEEIPDYIQFTLTSSDKVGFPLIAMTNNEEIQVDLSWDPLTIEPGKNTKFIFTIRDGTTGNNLRQSSYDFVIIQNGKEIHKTSGIAQVGGGFEDFIFSESQTGPTIIKFENIRGTGLEMEFGLVVVPEFGAIAVLIFFIAMITVFVVRKNYLKSIFIEN